MFSIIALCSNVSNGTIRRPRFILIIFTSTKPNAEITDAREAIIVMNSRLASTSLFSEILMLTELSRLVVFVANKDTIAEVRWRSCRSGYSATIQRKRNDFR